MPSTAPLQILLLRHPQDAEVLPYEEALVRVLQGGKEAGGYLANGDDLGIPLAVFLDTPQFGRGVAEILDGFCHTLTLVLVDRAFLQSSAEALWDWLEECWRLTDASNGRHGMLVVPMDERVGTEFVQMRPGLGTLQVRPAQELGERALRPGLLALRILHECRLLLAAGLPQPASAGSSAGCLRLFVSHAKIDGLPLARALKHQIEALGWLEDFYDADDLPPGRNWQKELEKGVGSSLLIMLRTENYENRHWCQQEVLWAEEYATPAVLVDARTGLQHGTAVLPLDRAPTVRIPDGNLLRVLFAALREGLRFVHFQRRVEAMKQAGELPDPVELRVFASPPGMSALLRACQSLKAVGAAAPDTPRLILYPDPVLRAGVREAAEALVEKHSPGTRLVTPQTLTALKGAI